MRDILKSSFPLFIICLAVALCLSLVNNITKDTIDKRSKEDAEEQRRQVLTAAKTFKEVTNWKEDDKSGIIREAYAGFDGEKLVGYVFSAYPKGYGGEINVTVGVGSDKRISGVRIGDNKETPGLGTKVSENDFFEQYSHKEIEKPFKVVKQLSSKDNVSSKDNEIQAVSGATVSSSENQTSSNDNEIQAISGATISSKAVTSAVQASADLGKILLNKGGNGE